MFSGGHDPSVSLLPDNKSAIIEPVQGGGGHASSSRGWQSLPVTIKKSSAYKPLVNHGSLKKFQLRWKQTLGPNIPSRRRPRQDPHVIVGILNVTSCPTYIVAPLRGDEDAANDVFVWASNLLETNPSNHIVFMGPLLDTRENTLIEQGISSLVSIYPGHVIYVCEKETGIPSLNGLLLHAVPNTSRQIALGFIPAHENVYHRSSRNLDCLEVETLRIPFSKVSEADSSKSIFNIEFNDPKAIKHREKDFDTKNINNDIVFKAIPGWVTQIMYKDDILDGGAIKSGPPVNLDESNTSNNEENEENEEKSSESSYNTVTLDSIQYKIRKNPSAAEEWKKGKFTPDEERLLVKEGFLYPKEIYPEILKVFRDKKCEGEAKTMLGEDCGFLRYLLANKSYNLAKNKSRPFKEVPNETNEEEGDEDTEDANEEGAENAEEEDAEEANDAENADAEGAVSKMISKDALRQKVTEMSMNMGTYNGDKTHKTDGKEGGGLSAGLATMQGKRQSQEDAHIVNVQLQNKPWYVSAVFDGHGGPQTSAFLETNLVIELNKKITSKTTEEDLKAVLPATYIALDTQLRTKSNNSGSTAIVVIVTPAKIIVANLGDSRAIGVKDGAVVWATNDHKPDSQEERDRITKAGHTVSDSRVNGNLALSRAFGDFTWKKEGGPPDEQAVSVIPVIELYERTAVDHIILGCDGVWDELENDHVAVFVNANKEVDSVKLADDIIDNSLILGSTDNISAIVVKVGSEATKATSGGGKKHSRKSRLISRNKTVKLRFIY